MAFHAWVSKHPNSIGHITSFKGAECRVDAFHRTIEMSCFWNPQAKQLSDCGIGWTHLLSDKMPRPHWWTPWVLKAADLPHLE